MAEKLKPGAIFVTFTKGLLTNGSYVRAYWIVRSCLTNFFSFFLYFCLFFFLLRRCFPMVDDVRVLSVKLLRSSQLSRNSDFLFVKIFHVSQLPSILIFLFLCQIWLLSFLAFELLERKRYKMSWGPATGEELWYWLY